MWCRVIKSHPIRCCSMSSSCSARWRTLMMRSSSVFLIVWAFLCLSDWNVWMDQPVCSLCVKIPSQIGEKWIVLIMRTHHIQNTCLFQHTLQWFCQMTRWNAICATEFKKKTYFALSASCLSLGQTHCSFSLLNIVSVMIHCGAVIEQNDMSKIIK